MSDVGLKKAMNKKIGVTMKMKKIIKTLAVEDGMDFYDIQSFRTESYFGIWHNNESFLLIMPSDIEFNTQEIPECNNLDELDDAVYDACGEHIIEVSSSGCYTFSLIVHS